MYGSTHILVNLHVCIHSCNDNVCSFVLGKCDLCESHTSLPLFFTCMDISTGFRMIVCHACMRVRMCMYICIRGYLYTWIFAYIFFECMYVCVPACVQIFTNICKQLYQLLSLRVVAFHSFELIALLVLTTHCIQPTIQHLNAWTYI